MLEKATTSLTALSKLPQFIESEVGSRKLFMLLQEVELPAYVLDQRNYFIPQTMLLDTFNAASRTLGEHRLGLIIGPYMTVDDYGVWGTYVLQAPTLGDAIARIGRALPHHSPMDRVTLRFEGDLAGLGYKFALAVAPGYENIATALVSLLVDVVRRFAGALWRPEFISLDVSTSATRELLSQQFGCDVLARSQGVEVCFDRALLRRPSTSAVNGPLISLHDVARERRGAAPTKLVDVVRELIRVQLMDGHPRVEQIARNLDIGVRRLQRSMEIDGTTFRSLANQVRAETAMELLGERSIPVTDIAMRLGYSTPAHFSRAFRHQVGCTPRTYRMHFGRS